jgi:hypothetical protein
MQTPPKMKSALKLFHFARKKFLFVASSLFFHSFPMTEKELIAHHPFAACFVVAMI